MDFFKSEKFKTFWFPFILALTFFLISFTTIFFKSDTTDEKFHLTRGLYLIEYKDLRLNQHHPYLFNLIYSIPVYFGEENKLADSDNRYWQTADKDMLSFQLEAENGGRAGLTELLFRARVTGAVFSAIFVFAFYQIVAKLLNYKAAGFSTILLTFSPTYLAHSGLVTTDVPATITIFLTTAALYHYLLKRSFNSLALFILLGGLALLTKFTAVLVAPIWLLLLYIGQFTDSSKAKAEFKELAKKTGLLTLLKKILIKAAYPLLAIICWIFIITAAYGFQTGSIYEMGYNRESYERKYDETINFANTNLGPKQADLVESIIKKLEVPAPQYVAGFLSNVVAHDITGHATFFMGRHLTTGTPSYFPLNFAIKETAFTVVFTLVALLWLVIEQNKHKSVSLWASKYYQYVPFVVVPIWLFILSTFSSINLGVRHILIVFPFLYILIGNFLSSIRHKKEYYYTFIGLLLTVPLSILSQFPYFIEYFNEPFGGPKYGYRLLGDSNYDWGQNDLAVEQKIQNYSNQGYTISRKLEDLESGGILVVRLQEIHYPKDVKEYFEPEYRNLADLMQQKRVQVFDKVSNTHYFMEITPELYKQLNQ